MNWTKRFLLTCLLTFSPILGIAQTLVNCAPATPCTMAGPSNTNTGDRAWLAFGKINTDLLVLAPLFNSTGLPFTLPVTSGGTGATTLTGLIKGNGVSAFSAATSADVISRWSGTCNATTFLRADGSCQSAAIGAWIDAGLTTDLTASITACVAASECTLILQKHDYTWPAGTQLPLGMNIIGQGWDGTHAYSAGVGSTIHTTDSSILVQALGVAHATVIQGVHFKDGLQVRKQHTTCFNCRFDGNGLIVGDNNNVNSPYYSRFIACHFDATDPGGTPIRLQNFANGVTFDGSLFVSAGGRGIDFQSAAQGNKFTLTQDYTGASSTDIKSIVYFSAGAISNIIDFIYWEDSSHTGRFTDGGHIVFGNSATQNSIFIPTNGGGALRVVHNDATRENYVETQNTRDATSNNSNFNWDYSFSDTVWTGSASTVQLPPTTLRRGALKLLASNNPVTVKSAFRYATVVRNANGSGGTTGVFQQPISDGNTVAGHEATVMITVAGGAMTAVSLVYPGWYTVSPSTSFAVTVGGLVGATLTLTVAEDQPQGAISQSSLIVGVNKLTTFRANAEFSGWVMFPYINDAVFAWGNSGAAPNANCSRSSVQSWTQNANVTWGVPSNPPFVGFVLTMLVQHDNTANSYTTAWNAIFRNAPAIAASAVANSKASFQFMWDGTSWQFMGGSTAFAWLMTPSLWNAANDAFFEEKRVA